MSKNKNILAILILVGVLFPSFVSATEPHELVMGSQQTLAVNVKNTGSVAISALQLELNALPPEVSYVNHTAIERILPGAIATFTIELNLSLNALEGLQTLQFVLKDKTGRRWQKAIEFVIVSQVPETTRMLPNYPSPFNPETWFPFELKEAANVSLEIYNLKGQRVRQLSLGFLAAGNYRNRAKAAYWDGRNHLGERLASGVYFCRFTAGTFHSIHKLVIQK